MKLLRVHPEAEAEAAGASDWYAVRSIPAAHRFDSQLKSLLQSLPPFPDTSLPYAYGTRRILFRRFPYFLVYRELLHEIQVIAVAHARRRPGYWSARIK
ncbi:MAG TPA: type II toxin-antitoxin system RelE/ParE family toxin [Terracidiphilus sp.]